MDEAIAKKIIPRKLRSVILNQELNIKLSQKVKKTLSANRKKFWRNLNKKPHFPLKKSTPLNKSSLSRGGHPLNQANDQEGQDMLSTSQSLSDQNSTSSDQIPSSSRHSAGSTSSDQIPSSISHHSASSTSSDEISDSSDEYQIEPGFTPVTNDSALVGLKAFQWMIKPWSTEEFFSNVWEIKPLYIGRKKNDLYKKLISTPVIHDILQQYNLQYKKNIVVTSWDKQHPILEGRANTYAVWHAYSKNECSIRFLDPQNYISSLHELIASMQEFFNSSVDAYADLTPPRATTDLPQYNGVELFILQAEGRKFWRIYEPSDKKLLPAEPSTAFYFTPSQLGKPLLERTLKVGDLLYVPRGFAFQATTEYGGEPSLHLNICINRKHSWADLFENMMHTALQKAIIENVELRKGLPHDIYDHCGVVHANSNTDRRQEIKEMATTLFDKIKNALPIDDAIDQMHKGYQHAAMPPVLTAPEQAVTVFAHCENVVQEGIVRKMVDISNITKIRLLRRNIIRMVSEDDKIILYYYSGNYLEDDQCPQASFEINKRLVSAIETLISAYPGYVSVEQLHIKRASDRKYLIDALWSRGVIMTEYPVVPVNVLRH